MEITRNRAGENETRWFGPTPGSNVAPAAGRNAGGNVGGGGGGGGAIDPVSALIASGLAGLGGSARRRQKRLATRAAA